MKINLYLKKNCRSGGCAEKMFLSKNAEANSDIKCYILLILFIYDLNWPMLLTQ